MKIVDFLRKPRNMFFSLLVMFAVVVGLTKISFSYYVGDSSNGTQIKLDEITNQVTSDDLTNGVLTLNAYESKAISITIKSLNEFDSAYKLYYTSNDNITIEKIVDYNHTIKAGEEMSVTLLVANPNDYVVSANIFTVSGYIGNDITYDAHEI